MSRNDSEKLGRLAKALGSPGKTMKDPAAVCAAHPRNARNLIKECNFLFFKEFLGLLICDGKTVTNDVIFRDHLQERIGRGHCPGILPSPNE